MSDLLVETYQVVLGAAPNDASATVVSPELRTKAAATAARDVLQSRVDSGDIELAPGIGLHIRTTPGNQTVSISDPVSRGSVISDLANKSATLVLFTRYRQPDNSVITVRWGSMPFSKARELDP